MTTYTNYTVNANGITQIAEFLKKYHKTGALLSEVKDSLNAYAADVEFSLNEGNDASFEISASNSVNKWTELCTITPDGLDAEVIEIDE